MGRVEVGAGIGTLALGDVDVVFTLSPAMVAIVVGRDVLRENVANHGSLRRNVRCESWSDYYIRGQGCPVLQPDGPRPHAAIVRPHSPTWAGARDADLQGAVGSFSAGLGLLHYY